MTPEEKRQEMGKAIVEFEGRFDKSGNLVVYQLPAGDGGGSFEVAGINERYHRAKVHEIKRLVDSGQHAKARSESENYILKETDCARNFFPSPEAADKNGHIEFLLRDSAWNRGCKGAATILQLALKVPVDGVVGPKTKAAFNDALEKDANALAQAITKARETYERNTYPWKSGKRDESNKFWKGLSNRWAKAHTTATNRFA